MVRKLPHFVSQVFECLMGFLLDVEDAPQWHLADSDQYEEEGAGELFDGGQEFLDRVAISLGNCGSVDGARAEAGSGQQQHRHGLLVLPTGTGLGAARLTQLMHVKLVLLVHVFH